MCNSASLLESNLALQPRHIHWKTVFFSPMYPPSSCNKHSTLSANGQSPQDDTFSPKTNARKFSAAGLTVCLELASRPTRLHRDFCCRQSLETFFLQAVLMCQSIGGVCHITNKNSCWSNYSRVTLDIIGYFTHQRTFIYDVRDGKNIT